MDQKAANTPKPIQGSTPVQGSGSRSRPQLSLIVGARNDSFTGNFNWRFETSLNYLADNLRMLGRLEDVEMVVTDWGSEIPLHKVLSLNAAARKIVRFLLVPPNLARHLQRDSEFPVVLAQNAAVRRCQGEYIAQTDSDILFPLEFLKGLFAILESRWKIEVPIDQALIVAKRHHLPLEYVSCNPHISKLDWFIRHFKPFFPLQWDDSCGFWATAMTMMHRQLWEDCGGYDERLIYRGVMEIDLGRRVSKKYSWFDLTNLGLTLFHLEHHLPGRGLRTRKWNPENWESLLFCPNGEDWGLNRYTLDEFRYPKNRVNTEPKESVQQQPIWLNLVLLATIADILIQKFMFPEPFRSWYAVGRKRAGEVWMTLKGKPLNQWPALLKGLWIERQQRRQTK